MLQIDLHAPTIPLDQRVWRLFPGSGYRFLPSFTQEGVGFLDFPGLKLPNGRLSDAKDLIARIARSQALRERLWQEGPDAEINLPLSGFEGSRHTQNRGRLRQALINLFEVARPSDFIVLPEPIYLSRVWIGQIVGEEVVEGYFERRYGPTPIPAREVRWIGSYRENTLSTALSQVLRHPHPFSVLERSLYLEVFSLAYGSFVYGERHASTVYNEKGDFLDADAALLGAITRLAAAACMSIDEGRGDLSSQDLADILLRNPPIEYTSSQEVDIHSPGFNRYISGSIVALVIAALAGTLIGLSDIDSKEALAEQINHVHIVNMAPNADPQCTARVSEASARVLRALGADRTWALCEAARAARNRAGLRSSAKPKRAPRN